MNIPPSEHFTPVSLAENYNVDRVAIWMGLVAKIWARCMVPSPFWVCHLIWVRQANPMGYCSMAMLCALIWAV